MVRSSKAVDELNPELAIVLEAGELGGVDLEAQVNRDSYFDHTKSLECEDSRIAQRARRASASLT